MVITVATTIGTHNPGASLNTVGQISGALTPYLGRVGAALVFGLGMLGAALVAAIVASLAGAWGLSEVFGWKHTLNERPDRSTAKFYITYALTHIVGAALVLASVDLVHLAIDVEVMNALLLPIVLGLLLVLEAKALPPQWRMRGVHKYSTSGDVPARHRIRPLHGAAHPRPDLTALGFWSSLRCRDVPVPQLA